MGSITKVLDRSIDSRNVTQQKFQLFFGILAVGPGWAVISDGHNHLRVNITTHQGVEENSILKLISYRWERHSMMLTVLDYDIIHTQSGHAQEQFLVQPSNDFECPICTQLIRDAVQCPAGHEFCRFCLSKWMSEKSSCPCCRTALDENSLIPSPTVNNTISELMVRCPTTVHSQYVCDVNDRGRKHNNNGDEVCRECERAGEGKGSLEEVSEVNSRCDWVGSLQSSGNHLLTCEFVQEFCEYSGCYFHGERRGMASHRAHCVFRPIRCPWCRSVFPAVDLPKHSQGSCIQSLCPSRTTMKRHPLPKSSGYPSKWTQQHTTEHTADLSVHEPDTKAQQQESERASAPRTPSPVPPSVTAVDTIVTPKNGATDRALHPRTTFRILQIRERSWTDDEFDGPPQSRTRFNNSDEPSDSFYDDNGDVIVTPVSRARSTSVPRVPPAPRLLRSLVFHDSPLNVALFSGDRGRNLRI